MKNAIESELNKERFSIGVFIREAGQWVKEIFATDVYIDDEKEYSKSDYVNMYKKSKDMDVNQIIENAELLAKPLDTEKSMLAEINKRKANAIIHEDKYNVIGNGQKENISQQISKKSVVNKQQSQEELER